MENTTGKLKLENKEETNNVVNPRDNLSSDPTADISESKTEPRRSNRKRIRAPPFEIRRINTRHKKLNLTPNIKDIENYYLNKNVQMSSPALETIFEEPKDRVMSVRKFKRTIHFGEDPSVLDKLKIKKRSMKAKKQCSNCIKVIRNTKDNHASMEKLLKVLEEADSDENETLNSN